MALSLCAARILLALGTAWLLAGAPAQALAQASGQANDAALACPVDRPSLALIIDRHGLAVRAMAQSRSVRLPGEPEIAALEARLSRFPERALVLLGEHEGYSCAWIWTVDASRGARKLVGVRLADTPPAQALDLPSLGRLHLPGRSARTLTQVPPIASVADLFARLQQRWVPAALLAALQGAREVVLLPTGVLAQLPWNALLMGGFGFRADLPAITVAASLATAIGAADKPALSWSPIDANDSVLVVGNPDYQGTLPQLPGAETEARLVAKILGVDPLVGRQATTGKVVEGLKKADVAFLATHGFSSHQAGLDGGSLALSDGRLNARDIQALKFEKMPLIVLSACETGLGQVHEAGTIGLARAFQIAGAFGVVMSLWSVDDEATQKLMLFFVDELQRAAPPLALLRAQNRLRQSHPDPRHWGAFNYFGSPIGFGP